MNTHSLVRIAGIFAFSAFVTGSAIAGPAYTGVTIKNKPVKEARATTCSMMKPRIVAQPGAHGTQIIKVPSNRCTSEMLSTCEMGDHTKC